MRNELAQVINLVEHEGSYFVSSKEVAERFGKRHDHVLRDIENLQVPDNFRLPNFEQGAEKDGNGIDRPVVYMTKDGFSILAFGFVGKKALDWKIMFLNAFNKMGIYLAEKVPELEARVRQLESEKKNLLLDAPKKQHHLKNTVLVPVSVNTLFGPEIEYHRVLKDSDRYSDLSYKEGKIRHLSSCANGMLKNINMLAEEIAKLRRM